MHSQTVNKMQKKCSSSPMPLNNSPNPNTKSNVRVNIPSNYEVTL